MKEQNQYKRALAHVKELKEFYEHLIVYLIYLVLWLVFNEQIVEFVIRKTEFSNSDFLNWLNINIILIPFLWGLGVAIHALYVFRFKFSIIKDWEEKKIAKFIEQENKKSNTSQEWE